MTGTRKDVNSVDIDSLKSRLKRPLSRLQNSRTDWYRIQNKAEKRPEIFIYDEIGFFGNSAKAFTDELQELNADELSVHINSPGGDIFDGLAIYQALKNHKADVTVHVDGLAASIASVIAMAADNVVMAPKASMMIHDGWTMAVGDAREMRSAADLLDKQSGIIASVYADKAGQTPEFWRARMQETTWYSADEAFDAGLVDEVEGREKKKADEGFDLSVFAYAGRENAPDPVIKPKAETPKEEPVAPEKEKQESFTWDFAAFKSSLKEGIRG